MSTNHNRSATQPVRALVLSGGGGRGAYEAGVAKACAERDFHFDWIVGTSIGALNAALVGQNDLDILESMWLQIRSNDVYKLPDPGHLRRVIFGQQLGLLNTAPLEQLLRSCISLEKLKAGPSKVGFVTTDLCGLRTKVITSDEIHSQEDLIDVLMASSAIPLLFPPRRLKGEGCWIDGGLVRNTPIQAAINLGATEIYAVLVEPKSVDTCPTSLTQLVSRLLEIVFDHSARSGIAHVIQHNRILDVGGLIAFDDSDLPAVRRALRLLLANRAYEVAFPQVVIEPRRPTPTSAARLARALGRLMPKLGTKLRPDFLVPDEQLGLRGRCIVLRKLAQDSRDSQSRCHVEF